MNQIIEQMRADGRPISDEQLARLSPTITDHILINGRYHIDPNRTTDPSRSSRPDARDAKYH